MKKLTLLMILTINFCYSQNLALSLAADLKNAVKGSEATNNKPALNLLAEFTMVSDRNVEISIEYERFNKINFSRFGFGVGYQIPLMKNIKIIPSVSYNLIDRWGENWNNSSYLGLGGNVGIRYEINDFFAVELKNQFLNRVDLNVMYGVNVIRYSGFVKLIYKIGLDRHGR